MCIYERERRTEEEERQKAEINTAQQERRKGRKRRKGEIVDADRESCNLFPMAPVPNSVVTALQSPRL